MKTRILVGTALIVALGLIAWLDSLWPAGYAYIVCMSLVTAAALREFYVMAERAGARVPMLGATAAGLAIVIGHWMMGQKGFSDGRVFTRQGTVVGILTVACLGCFFVRTWSSQIEGALLSIGATVLGLLYIPVVITFMTAMRREMGVAGLIAFVAVCKSGDIGAYIVGSRWGRLGLAPRVSPKKTVEGAVAAVAVSVAVSLILTRLGVLALNLWVSLLFGLVVGSCSVVGDLAESLLKRDSKIKDSATFLPGFGGVLDLIDDLLYTAPIAYGFLRVALG